MTKDELYQKWEREAMAEYLATDPIATYTVPIFVPAHWRDKKHTDRGMVVATVRHVGLASFIDIKEQDVPEYFTVKQAQMLNPKFTARRGQTHVPRDVAFEVIAEKWGLTADELADRIEAIRRMKQC